MDGPVFGLCAVVALISAAILVYLRFTQERRSSLLAYRVSQRAHFTSLVCCFVGTLLAVPDVADAVDSVAGSDDVSFLISDIAAVIFCASLQVLIIDWEYNAPHHAGIALRIGFVFVVAALLILEFRRADRVHLDLSTTYVRNSEVRTYLLTYLGFFAAAGLEVTMRSAKIARAVRRQGRPSATGLSITTAGAAFGILYAISRGGYVLAFEGGHTWPLAIENTLSPVLAGMSVICLIGGLTLAVLSSLGLKRAGRST
ncbi:hypothetical protein [Streptomyces misionensis]|uniref:hypothetical protein n=1 Tax=Streptomyces misionensis TaxID=67331 RepID=UPI00396BC5D6